MNDLMIWVCVILDLVVCNVCSSEKFSFFMVYDKLGM